MNGDCFHTFLDYVLYNYVYKLRVIQLSSLVLSSVSFSILPQDPKQKTSQTVWGPSLGSYPCDPVPQTQQMWDPRVQENYGTDMANPGSMVMSLFIPLPTPMAWPSRPHVVAEPCCGACFLAGPGPRPGPGPGPGPATAGQPPSFFTL